MFRIVRATMFSFYADYADYANYYVHNEVEFCLIFVSGN